jgi:hypothetical protein
MGETLILIEVTKIPSDMNDAITAGLFLILLLFVIGVGVVIVRFVSRIRIQAKSSLGKSRSNL